MKLKLIAFLGLCSAGLYGQIYESHSVMDDRVSIQLSDGEIEVIPMTESAVRIRYHKEDAPEVPEIIFSSEYPTPAFQVADSDEKVTLKTKRIAVFLDKQSGRLSFSNDSGEVFLSEKAGSRELTSGSVMGEPCYVATQSFESPVDESLFGLGQFQDGQYDLRGITRRLTQVNSQISIPFIYSSKGYGLLWHQYGLTEFNPADNLVELEKQEQPSSEEGGQMAEVTTTSGTQKVSQSQSLYKGEFQVPEDGMYSIFLNLGDMGNRQFVAIDGEVCIDQSNFWLPPTAGTLVSLKAGKHKVQLVCQSRNTPQVSWKLEDGLTTFRSPNARLLDYVVFYGPSADRVIADYRQLSGEVPMLPQWAYGFWQCRERYTSSSHLIETVEAFRERKLPMDVIVQDWQYWGGNGWGVPKFDEANYPDPGSFIGELHDLGTHFCVSVWSNPEKSSEIGQDYVAKNQYIPDSKWLDYFNPQTRKDYWNTLKENLFDYGVDAWWMDATEPENDALVGKQTFWGLGDFYRLTYPLLVSEAVYEGQRETTSEKRVCILTRSAFSGQQRYGVINWSGDIGGTWDSYRRQIVAGLNFVVTGFPYWTTDIGGFFRPGESQYTDKDFQELLIRWFQWGAFNPIFRSHGYQTETEPWKYGEVVESHVREILNLRYRLLPYIYSEAWQITEHGSTLMRPLVMDFREDSLALKQPHEYMFGKALLVAPVIEPGIAEREVYLPQSADWYDFWTNRHYEGGETISADAPLDRIPVFVKAGSIIPMGKPTQHTNETAADLLEIRVYTGADTSFELYEDTGDGYSYEEGEYSIIPITWDEESKTLTIGKRQGSYPGSLVKRTFNILFFEKHDPTEPPSGALEKRASYKGKKVEVKIK